LDTETRLRERHPIKKTLTINNIESFYNYRTVGEEYNMTTSVLSNCVFYKLIQKNKIDQKPNDCVIIDETPLIDSSVHYGTILAKKQRINAALLQIKMGHTDFENFEHFNELFNYFALSLEPEENDVVAREKPLFCRGQLERTLTKSPCMECDTICAY
jgi:hypothetical protein